MQHLRVCRSEGCAIDSRATSHRLAGCSQRACIGNVSRHRAGKAHWTAKALETETSSFELSKEQQIKKLNTAVFKANKTMSQPVKEQQKPLADYMALPASQYSVLDARQIERVDDTTFRCFVGQLKFFSWSVEPVITVSVEVEPQGCTIKLLSCQLQGSSFVDDINSKFTATMTNVVRWQPGSTDEEKLISSSTALQVTIEVPKWVSFIPTSSIDSVGCSVMQSTVELMVPRFLQQLQTDYAAWASGDTSRKPMSE